jgi:hypothetical protein
VDNQVLVDSENNNKIVFAQIFDNKMWVNLLEKAYADYFGGYY